MLKTPVTICLLLVVFISFPTDNPAYAYNDDAAFMAEMNEFLQPPDELDTNLNPASTPDIISEILNTSPAAPNNKHENGVLLKEYTAPQETADPPINPSSRPETWDTPQKETPPDTPAVPGYPPVTSISIDFFSIIMIILFLTGVFILSRKFIKRTNTLTPSIQCDQCGSTIPEDHNFCTSCGAPAPDNKPKSTNQNSDLPICPACGYTLQPDILFCTNCGEKL
jgi:DNA-directed RNA polymerase subunit RPC12/RpoP